MADDKGKEKVHKSFVMDRGLAGAINAWAVGAGVGFSEAVRRLCAQALAEWPEAAGVVVDEVRRAERRLSSELARISARIAVLESQNAESLAMVAGIVDDYDENGCYDTGHDVVDAEGEDDEAGDQNEGSSFDPDEFDREFDEWWEAKKNEWN